MLSRGGKQRIIVPGNDRGCFHVQAAEGPVAGWTTEFAGLRWQLDAADANIALVNKRLDEEHGMYFRIVSKY